MIIIIRQELHARIISSQKMYGLYGLKHHRVEGSGNVTYAGRPMNMGRWGNSANGFWVAEFHNFFLKKLFDVKDSSQIGGNRLLSLHRVQLAHRKVERLQSVFIGNSRPQSEAWEEQQKANSRRLFQASVCLSLFLSLSQLNP